jgi:pilus assembly protein CpaB
MKRAQIIAIGLACVAGVGVFLTLESSPPPPPSAPPPPAVEDILVTTRDLAYGLSLRDDDMKWIAWPKDQLPKGAISKSESPQAKDELRSYYLLSPLPAGEPLRRERLSKGPPGGIMASLLSPGKRAITIEYASGAQSLTGGGGFILPGDRVDIFTTFSDSASSGAANLEAQGSQLLLPNVRVLAIGPAYETKAGEATLPGSTATLELDPDKAALVLLAQRKGQLTLALRPNSYKAGNSPETSEPPFVTILRAGVPSVQRAR